MKLRTVTVLLAVSGALAGCGDDPVGPGIGDLTGTWVATTYEFRDNATGTMAVDLIQAGGSLTMAIDGSQDPPTINATFDDGSGGGWTAAGTVNESTARLAIGAGVFSITLNGSQMTLTNSNAVYNFQPGVSVASTVTMVLDRQ